MVKTGRDKTGCGRWSYITFNGKDNKQITVINAYRVCAQTEAGDTTTSKQQQCIQYTDNELRPFIADPHKKTLIDLKYFVQEQQQEGEDALLFLDANQHDQHAYRPQDHRKCFKTSNGFHADGSIDGPIHTFMSSCGPTNTH
jgi:hypothetical protein